ncbi:hypothetical protein [Enterococcus sp. AZ191]|uniref:hypothetical protein n=1 Tax=Enterococcus sp. AZ191 TaxID=2774639 RepID=UPI003F682A84
MKKKVTGEDGKTYVMKEKKPFYKRVWFWILVVLVVFIVGGALSGGDDNTVKSQTESSTSENISDTEYSSLSESQYSSTSTSVTLEESSNPFLLIHQWNHQLLTMYRLNLQMHFKLLKTI